MKRRDKRVQINIGVIKNALYMQYLCTKAVCNATAQIAERETTPNKLYPNLSDSFAFPGSGNPFLKVKLEKKEKKPDPVLSSPNCVAARPYATHMIVFPNPQPQPGDGGEIGNHK